VVETADRESGKKFKQASVFILLRCVFSDIWWLSGFFE
jgi:hypothetical protein